MTALSCDLLCSLRTRMASPRGKLLPVEQQPLTAASAADRGGGRWGVSSVIWLRPDPEGGSAAGEHSSTIPFTVFGDIFLLNEYYLFPESFSSRAGTTHSFSHCRTMSTKHRSQSDLKLLNKHSVTNSVKQKQSGADARILEILRASSHIYLPRWRAVAKPRVQCSKH